VPLNRCPFQNSNYFRGSCYSWKNTPRSFTESKCEALKGLRGYLANIDLHDQFNFLAFTCKLFIAKDMERYVVSFPLLGMFTGDEPTVTQSISALNRKPNKTVMVVTYTRHNNNHVTKMITGTIGENNVFNYTLSNEDDFLSESGVGTASVVITAYVKFAVSYVYSFFGTAESRNVTYVEFKFAADVSFDFKTGDIEMENPRFLKVSLQQYDTAFIMSGNDLSGTFIAASYDVVVFTGYTVKGCVLESVYMIQAQPVSQGLKRHYCAPPSGLTSPETYRVVALANNTKITAQLRRCKPRRQKTMSCSSVFGFLKNRTDRARISTMGFGLRSCGYQR
ncbi:hypothetical protein RRG08_048869, partial [Elysia crispata]